MELVSTKFVPPLEPVRLLDRPRLRERLEEVARHRLTLVKAPAGYGKTTLLAQWYDALRGRGGIGAWITLDRRDRTGDRLVGGVAAMMATDPRLGPRLDGLVRNEAAVNVEGLLATIVERVAAAGSPVTLFFDDLHALGPEATRAFDRLLRALPRNARVVAAARETRELELAAWRAYGQLLEVGHAELRFTVREAAALLAGSGLAALEPQDIEALVARTEGWVTGLKLAALALAGEPDRTAVLAAFSGRRRAVADFFAEDVFAGQSEAVRCFLLDTAVLDRLSPALCDAVTGRRGAATMLRHLEEIGLFIVALDDEGTAYRYHSLFAEFLERKRAETDPGAAERLHRRAALWLAESGSSTEALEHALKARDFSLLGALLEGVAEEFTYTGRLGIVARYAALLPDAVRAACPWTLACVAWLEIRGLRFVEARALLDAAKRALEELRGDQAAGSEAVEALEHAIAHRELMFAAARDDVTSIEGGCARLARYFESRRPYIACTLDAQLIVARREQFRFDGLDRLHVRGRTTAERSGYRLALIALQAAAGVSLFAAGRTEAAGSALRQGLEESLRWAGRSSGLAALVALPLAEIAYETNDLPEAGALVEAHLPVARELSLADGLVAGHLVAARMCAARDDLAGARRALDSATQVALECDLERLHLAVIDEGVRLLIRNGLPDAAARHAAEAGLPEHAELLAPHAGTTTRDELRAAIWVRLALGRDRACEALAVIKQWRSFCAQRGAVRAHVRWNLLMAQLLALTGDGRAAQRVMREAVAAAAPAGLVRAFVDEGEAVRSILAEACADDLQSQHPTDVFAGVLLAAFGTRRPVIAGVPACDEGLYGRLSGKELEILTLVGCGLRNREIGTRLGLSEGSVKWYMQQVYDKVGIRRRSQAVERARHFGLIA